MRNLSYGSTEGELVAHLEGAAGPDSVAAASMLLDADGRPRGLARVRMRTPEQAQKVMEALSGQSLGGRSLNIEFDERQARTARGGGRGRGGRGRGRGRGR